MRLQIARFFEFHTAIAVQASEVNVDAARRFIQDLKHLVIISADAENRFFLIFLYFRYLVSLCGHIFSFVILMIEKFIALHHSHILI